MSDSASPLFEEPKTNRWVWIVPSVVLHVVILVIWLNMPEPPPRMPGERKLTVEAEQAEQLQEHVEESNLELLQANVAELQEIRDRMNKIRAQRMEKLVTFESEMKQEAPQDIAGIVAQIVITQQKIIELHAQMDEASRNMMQKVPEARTVMESSEPEGIRAIAALASIQAPLQPMDDQFEALYLEITADLRTIEQRYEWISNQEQVEKFNAYQTTLNQASEAHRRAFRSVKNAYAGKFGRYIQFVSQDPEAIISKLENFDQEVAAGKAKAEKERAALQAKIDANEARQKELDVLLEKERNTLKGIDRKKERDAYSAQVAVVRPLESEWGALARTLKDDRRRVGGIRFSPERNLAKEIQRTRGMMTNVLKGNVDPAVLDEARAEYDKVLRASEDFIAYLGGTS